MQMLSFENEKEFEFSEIQKQKQSDYQDVQKMITSSDKFVSCSPDDEKLIEEFDSGQLELKKNFMDKIDNKEEEYKNNEFILKDIDTGKVYDLQNKTILDNLTEKIVKINIDPKEKAWQEYWYDLKNFYLTL